MASSSNSSSSSTLMRIPTRRKKNYYDVFVSFRGKDTRFNFIDHLFAAFQRKGIFAFRDDTKIQKGESISYELIRAIEDSHIFIVVFSLNYASSIWCLQELEKIVECSQLYGTRVLPVFYDVSPSDVRYQHGVYGDAFFKHEERFQLDSFEMVQRWREALTQVANLSGWDLRDKPQYAEIEKIIEEIKSILGHKFSSLQKGLVGMDSPMEELEKLLLLDSVDVVRVVGIYGMGGIGKTTLAKVLYGRISHHFDACCFIDDISKVYRHDGPIGAQKQILHQALGEERLQTYNLCNATDLIGNRLSHMRALLVVDNVDKFEQLEKLAVNSECLGAGSRIIITSRDAHILKEYGVDEVYEAPLLNATDSILLFCQKAFKRGNIVSNYEKLAFDILNYANGLPLAIKVLGSFLFGRDISQWRSALSRLRESPNKDIMDVLRLSFEGLEKLEQEIFLDIACFFKGHPEEYVRNVLNTCGFHPDIGLRVLIDKSLISISDNFFIKMHSLLEELGRKIVQENLIKDSRKWSRIWLHKHFDNVMSENMEKNVEAIVLKHQYPREIKTLAAEMLSNMCHLRLLILKDVRVLGILRYLSNKLRFVEWPRYPFMYLPVSFQPNQLVELILKHSKIEQLWEGNKYLPNLKTMDLKHSKNLIKMPDFEDFANLERLNLKGCVSLVQVDSSIGLLRKLVFLKLKDCKNLIKIPNGIFNLGSLKYLNLSGCSTLFNNPRHLMKLDWRKYLNLFLKLPFHSLFPRAHKGLASCLLSSLRSFSFLWELDISFCGLSQIPDAIGCMRWLGRLNLMGNNFVTLPSLSELSKLVYLNLQHYKQLKFLSELPFPEHPSPVDKHDQNGRGGLYIFNCPELGEREHCSSMTFSWIIQFIQVNQESFACFPWIDIVIPRIEIPRWFDNKSVDNSISIELSPIVHDNSFVGLACCVVFSVTFDDSSVTTNEWGPVIWLGFECVNTNGVFALCPVIFDRSLITVESNHTWLIYVPRESFIDFLSSMNTTFRDLDHIIMETSLVDAEGLHVEVKECGYHCIFKQDLQQLNLTMMHQKTSFCRKRKFLAIED